MRSALVWRELGYICGFILYQSSCITGCPSAFRQIQPGNWQPRVATSASEKPR
ncbi:hypothetical protein ACVWXO_008769 [Bradyrhizobium sp. LM2.7]